MRQSSLFLVVLFLLIAFIWIGLHIYFFDRGILENIFNLVVYKEYLNEYLVLALLFILFFKKNKYIDFLLYLLFTFVLFVDFIQFLSRYYSGAFITIAALDNVSNVLLFANLKVFVAVTIFVLFYSLLMFVLLKIKKVKYRKIGLGVLVLITGLNFYLYYLNKKKDDVFEKFAIEKGPVLTFVKVIYKYFNPPKIENIKLTKEEINLAKRLYLINDYNSSYPIIKNFFYKKRLSQNLSIKPNIILIIAESLSAKFVDVYNKKDLNVTPNLDSLAKKGFYIKNYINHTFPTIRGIYGQLCSIYPEFRVKEVVDNYNTYKFYKKKCLPMYLNEYGYHTVYLNHGNRKRQEIERFSKGYGFKERLFNVEISKLIKQEPHNKMDMDMSDQQMAQAVITYLKKYNKKEPLFLCFSTIETHTGYSLGEDGVKRKDLDGVLNNYYNLDNALGKLFKYIENSRYKNNTIIIVTGDHVRPDRYEKYKSNVYGELALIIYSPFFKVKPFFANTSSIDLAPTILHLINYPNKVNAFEGISLFDRNTSLAIGATIDNGMFYAKFKGKRLIKAEQFDKPNDKLSKKVYDIMNYIYYQQKSDHLFR